MENTPYPRIYLYRRIVEAKLFLDRHFREPINLSQMAAEAKFSKFHFHRLFRECYGKTPHAYLTALRLAEAKKMLEAGYGCREVCHAIGFESSSSFIRLFKKQEKLTPAAYSRKALAQRASIQAAPLQHIPGSFATYLGWAEQ